MKKGVQLVFLTSLISGVSIFVNAFGVQNIQPYIFTGLKNIIVALLLFSFILIVKEFQAIKKLSSSEWIKLILVGLIGGSIPFLLFFQGLKITTAASGAFVHKTMIIWVIFLAMIFLKEKINFRLITGALIILVGSFLLLRLTNFGFNQGTILILIATLLWAGELILSKHLLKNLSGNTVAFGRMFFGSIFIVGFLTISGNLGLVLSLPAASWQWILLTSLLLLGYVYTFYNGLKQVKVSTAVAVLSLGSVITTMLNLVFLDRYLVFSQVIGLVLIIFGVLAFVGLKETMKLFSQASQQHKNDG